MKATFLRGALIVFSLGVIAFLVYFVLDFITKLFRPAFSSLVGDDTYLITLIGVAAILFLIWAIGFLFAPQNLTGRWGRFWGRVPILNWFMGERRIPRTVHDMPGALVKFADGSYYIAALVGEQKFVDKNGTMHKMYRLYCPSAPVPWSGLPLIFARAEQVILLKLSFAEIYGITTSFGRTTPELLEELELTEGSMLDETKPTRERN